MNIVIRKKSLIIGIAIVTVFASLAGAAQSPQVPIAGNSIPQFVNQLPKLSVQGGTMKTLIGNTSLTLHMCEFDAQVLPPGTFVAGEQPLTRVWGYIPETSGVTWTGCPTTPQDTYLGPVIVNTRSTLAAPANPTSITWINDLGTTASTGVLAYKYSTDQTLHWADPLNAEENMCGHMAVYPAYLDPCSLNYGEVEDPDPANPRIFTNAPIPAVPHLHGGEVPAEIDGGPDSWFTSNGAYKGHGYYTFPGASAPANGAIYKYPNTQEAAPIWFHDHTMGATRLNVYAGMAGGYVLTDPSLNLPTGLHPVGLNNGAPSEGSTAATVEYTIPLIIQDRMFDTHGELFFQADSGGGILWALNP